MPLVARRTLLAVGLGGAAAIALHGVPAPTPAHGAAQARIGEPAPAFSLADSYGKAISLADFRGKTVVLEWTNHDCPYVRKHYGANYMGGIDDRPTTRLEDLKTAKNFVDAALTELAQGEPVSQTTARPYGCSVKYSW